MSYRPVSIGGLNKVQNILHKAWLRIPEKTRPKAEYKLEPSAHVILQEYLDELTK